MLKELRKLAYLSMAFVAISYGSHPANAAATGATVFSSAGTCTGVAFVSGTSGADCVQTTGHINASVVSTLSINEIRAVNFGNMTIPCGGLCAGGANAASIVLNPVLGTRTYSTAGTDTLTLLTGYSARNAPAGGAAGNFSITAGGFSPGILEVKGATEGAATQVYISFADSSGNPVDYTGESFYPGNDTNIHVIGPGGVYFTAQDFQISCAGLDDADGIAGNDVYGHFCFTPDALPLNIKVGMTLKTAAQTYVVGKYTGTYNAMVSY